MINFFKKLKKVKYGRLNNIDVIVIHDNDTLFIDKYILSPLKVKYYVFEPENEIIINFKIIFHSLRYFIQGNNFYLSYTKGLIKSKKRTNVNVKAVAWTYVQVYKFKKQSKASNTIQ